MGHTTLHHSLFSIILKALVEFELECKGVIGKSNLTDLIESIS